MQAFFFFKQNLAELLILNEICGFIIYNRLVPEERHSFVDTINNLINLVIAL